MDLYQIKHFVAVVEGGGFTKGAERVAVSQPAISASIAKLEAELNVKLLERRHSQVVPTPAGTRLLEMGRTILQTCNAAKSEVKAIADRRPLRIAVMSPLSSGPVSNLLNSFQQANPNIPIEVVDGHCDGWCNCDQLFGPLDEGDRDAVLSILNDRLASKFATQALFKIPYMLAVPADHRFAQRQAVSAGDLAGERLILPERCVYMLDVTNALASLGVRANVVYRTDNDDRALALVAAGFGLALVPGHFEIAGVKQVPVPDLAITRTIGLVWPRERENGDVKEFIAFAESHRWAA